MRSAVLFRPSYIMQLMNLDTVWLSYRASGRTVRFTALLRRLIYFFPPFPPLPVAAGWPGFGFLVPYLERLRLRPFTPDASSDPRTTWERPPGRAATPPP